MLTSWVEDESEEELAVAAGFVVAAGLSVAAGFVVAAGLSVAAGFVVAAGLSVAAGSDVAAGLSVAAVTAPPEDALDVVELGAGDVLPQAARTNTSHNDSTPATTRLVLRDDIIDFLPFQ